MGKSAKTRKRQESRSGDGITTGTVRGASRVSPSGRASPAPNPAAQLSTPASPSSSSEALSEIVAEIVVWTDDMEPAPSVSGSGEGRDEPSVAAPAPFDGEGGDDMPVAAPEYVISSSHPLEDCVLCDATLHYSHLHAPFAPLLKCTRLIRAAQASGCRVLAKNPTRRRAWAEPRECGLLAVYSVRTL